MTNTISHKPDATDTVSDDAFAYVTSFLSDDSVASITDAITHDTVADVAKTAIQRTTSLPPAST